VRIALLALLVAGGSAAAQTSTPPAGKKEEKLESLRAAAAAKLAQAAAETYTVTVDSSRDRPLVFQPKPILQWSNPVVGSIHGSVFVWTAKGRPELVASIYKWYGPVNFHLAVEFHSLATGPITARENGSVVWSPTQPGLTFTPVPGAPVPAGTPAQRLRQMRALAQEFTAFETDREKVPRDLRLLTQPVYRYNGTEPPLLDGGLFTFVLGTDPEVFLLLEARRRPDGGYGWDYALARMNSVILRVSHRGREVWNLPEQPWSVVFGHAEPYTIFVFEAGQGVNIPGPDDPPSGR
jgi:hypothetical protein